MLKEQRSNERLSKEVQSESIFVVGGRAVFMTERIVSFCAGHDAFIPMHILRRGSRPVPHFIRARARALGNFLNVRAAKFSPAVQPAS